MLRVTIHIGVKQFRSTNAALRVKKMMIGQRMACNRLPHPDSPPSKINSKTAPIPLSIHPRFPNPRNAYLLARWNQ